MQTGAPLFIGRRLAASQQPGAPELEVDWSELRPPTPSRQVGMVGMVWAGRGYSEASLFWAAERHGPAESCSPEHECVDAVAHANVIAPQMPVLTTATSLHFPLIPPMQGSPPVPAQASYAHTRKA